MSDIIIIDKKEINTLMPAQIVLLCFASFEARSTTIPLSLDTDRIKKAIVFRSNSIDNQSAVNAICKKIPNSKVVDLDLDNPISAARKLTEVVKELPSLENYPLVVDITTFTHEILAILLKLVYLNKDKFPYILCLYNGAYDYSNSKKDGLKQMWLSKGCRDVRNVVGYPGKMRSAAKTCLIILTGFELERATRLIELLEPDRIILGKGTEPTHPNHLEAMQYFQRKFDEWKASYKYSNCIEFAFSCKDFEMTVNALKEQILKNPEDNYIIVPLNTKLSTIAVASVALCKPEIQICYAVPEMYNTKNYSTPSDNITVLDLNKVEIFT